MTEQRTQDGRAAGSFLHAASLDCIHCGLCLRSCPTYQLTGSEASSPRGRVHLMRAAEEGRIETGPAFAEEMDFCLLCRHCESACPAGVRFGSMMEHTRAELERGRRRPLAARALRSLGFGALRRRWALSLIGALARLAQQSGLDRITAALLGRRGRLLREAPAFPPLASQRPLPRRTPPASPPVHGRALILEGCVMPVLFGDVNRDLVRILTRLGLEVEVPPKLTCCGSLHAHNGELEAAIRLAREAIEAFERDPDATIVIHSAGCGSHLRELPGLFAESDPWRGRAAAVSARVKDLSEVLVEHLDSFGPKGTSRVRVAWDAPCHLCHGQGVRSQPLAILERLPQVDLVPLDDAESCCGSAGVYSLLRPDDAAQVLEGKLDALERSGASVLVTSNPGCQLQWQQGIDRRGLTVEVRHLAELVAEALGAHGLHDHDHVSR
jgi:glycolate oxidase iron-sulfur subunit